MEEPRHVKVQKGSEPLGISIVSGENGGIFVSKVTGGSIAHQAGLEYGDQLLEVIVYLLFLWLNESVQMTPAITAFPKRVSCESLFAVKGSKRYSVLYCSGNYDCCDFLSGFIIK